MFEDKNKTTAAPVNLPVSASNQAKSETVSASQPFQSPTSSPIRTSGGLAESREVEDIFSQSGDSDKASSGSSIKFKKAVTSEPVRSGPVKSDHQTESGNLLNARYAALPADELKPPPDQAGHSQQSAPDLEFTGSKSATRIKYFVIGAAGLLIIVAGLAAWWLRPELFAALPFVSRQPADSSSEQPQPESEIIDEPAVEPPATPVDSAPDSQDLPEFRPEPAGQGLSAPTGTPVMTLDTDGDGLSDDEERRLGTSSTSTDTDGDGLFDREEVKVYLTNPSDSDTDGDGFADGEEVNNGYNPKGPGKLLPEITQ